MKIGINWLFVLSGLVSLLCAVVAGYFLLDFALDVVHDSILVGGYSQADAIASRIHSRLEAGEVARNATQSFFSMMISEGNLYTHEALVNAINKSSFYLFASQLALPRTPLSGFEIVVLLPRNAAGFANTTGFFRSTLYFDPGRNGGRDYVWDTTAIPNADNLTHNAYSVDFTNPEHPRILHENILWSDSYFKLYYQTEVDSVMYRPQASVGDWVGFDGLFYWFTQQYMYFRVDGMIAVATSYQIVSDWYDLIADGLREFGGDVEATQNNSSVGDTVVMLIEARNRIVLASSIAAERARQQACFANVSEFYEGRTLSGGPCSWVPFEKNPHPMIRMVADVYLPAWSTDTVQVPTYHRNVKVGDKNYLVVIKQLVNNEGVLYGLDGFRLFLVWARDVHSVQGELKQRAWITIGVAAFFIVLATVFVISSSVFGLLRPLKRLSNQMEKLKDVSVNPTQQLDEDQEDEEGGGSAMTEVANLQQNFIAMSAAVRSFSRYVPSELVKDLVRSGKLAATGVSRFKISIMFMDIAGFTGVCTVLKSALDVVSEFLTVYYEMSTKILLAHGATIDKFMGDGIMCFWNAPLKVDHHSFRCVGSGIQLKAELSELFQRLKAKTRYLLRVRIGAEVGMAMCGNVGCHERLSYTAMGDAVNTASRLEAFGKELHSHFLVSKELLMAACMHGDEDAMEEGSTHQGDDVKLLSEKSSFAIRYCGPCLLVGRDDVIHVFEVLGLKKSAETAFVSNPKYLSVPSCEISGDAIVKAAFLTDSHGNSHDLSSASPLGCLDRPRLQDARASLLSVDAMISTLITKKYGEVSSAVERCALWLSDVVWYAVQVKNCPTSSNDANFSKAMEMCRQLEDYLNGGPPLPGDDSQQNYNSVSSKNPLVVGNKDPTENLECCELEEEGLTDSVDPSSGDTRSSVASDALRKDEILSLGLECDRILKQLEGMKAPDSYGYLTCQFKK